MLFFSKYVDDHAEQLRSAFVNHKDKKVLTVKSDKVIEDIENLSEEFFKPMMN